MMTLGNAVGTAAALTVKENVMPKVLEVKKLQKELLKQGFYLGDESRLKKLGLIQTYSETLDSRREILAKIMQVMTDDRLCSFRRFNLCPAY